MVGFGLLWSVDLVCRLWQVAGDQVNISSGPGHNGPHLVRVGVCRGGKEGLEGHRCKGAWVPSRAKNQRRLMKVVGHRLHMQLHLLVTFRKRVVVYPGGIYCVKEGSQRRANRSERLHAQIERINVLFTYS